MNGYVTHNCVPAAMSKIKSVLIAVVETVKVVLKCGRLVGNAKKKPVNIVLNIMA